MEPKAQSSIQHRETVTGKRKRSCSEGSDCDWVSLLGEEFFRLSYFEEGEDALCCTDWTIVVTCSTGEKRTFHVHQEVLEATNPYFKAIFRSPFYSENEIRCSYFDFPPFVAKNFDVFLDRLYAPDSFERKHFRLTDSAVCTLLFLHDYFCLACLPNKLQHYDLIYLPNRLQQYLIKQINEHWRFGSALRFCYLSANCFGWEFMNDLVIDFSIKLLEKRGSGLLKGIQDFLRTIDTPTFFAILRHEKRFQSDCIWMARILEFCRLHRSEGLAVLEVAKQEQILPPLTGLLFVELFQFLQDFEETELDEDSSKSRAVLEKHFVKEFHTLLMYKETLNAFDGICHPSCLPKPILKMLVRQSTKITSDQTPRGCDAAALTLFLRQQLEKIKCCISPDPIPVTLSNNRDLDLDGNFYYDRGTRKYYHDSAGGIISLTLKDERIGEWRIHSVYSSQCKYIAVETLRADGDYWLPPFKGWKVYDTSKDADFSVSF